MKLWSLCAEFRTPFRRGNRLQSGLLLAASVAAMLPIRAIATDTSTQKKEQAQRERLLLIAEAARKCLTESESVNPEKGPSDAASERHGQWGGVAIIQAWGQDFPAALATVAAHISPQYNDGYTYGTIASEQARAGDIAGAKESVKLAKESKSYRLNRAQGEIALAEGRNGDWQAAQARMAPAANEDESAPSEGLYDAFVDGVLAGNAQDVAWLDQFLATVPEDKAKTLPDFERFVALQAVGWARSGQLDRAQSALAKIKDTALHVWVRRNIALQQAKAGDMSGAKETLEPAGKLLEANFAAADKEGLGNKNAEKYRRVDLLRRLALTQWRTGDKEGAERTIEPIKNIVDTYYERAISEFAGAEAEGHTSPGSRLTCENLILRIRHEDLRAQAWGYVAHAELKRRDVENAKRSARRAVGLLQAAKEDEFLMALDGRSASWALGELGEFAEAFRIAELISGAPAQDDRYKEGVALILSAVARQQGAKAVQDWVEKLTTDPKTRAMYYVRTGHALTGAYDQTQSIDTEDE